MKEMSSRCVRLVINRNLKTEYNTERNVGPSPKKQNQHSALYGHGTSFYLLPLRRTAVVWTTSMSHMNPYNRRILRKRGGPLRQRKRSR